MRNEILTERTRITPFVAEHIPVILKMYQEPDSNKWIEPMLNKSEDFYLEKLKKNVPENEKELMYWSAFHRETNDFVGTLNMNVFQLSGHQQIGLHLARDFWNQGYGFELCTAMLEYAKNIKKMEVIHWVYEVGHDVSEKLARKLGFSPFEELMDGDCAIRIYKKAL